MSENQTVNRERRLFPRVSASFPVHITLEEKGEPRTFESVAINISIGGIVIEANSELVDCFKKQIKLPCVGDLNFTLPDASSSVKVRAKLVNYRRLSQHSYTVSLCFVKLDEEGTNNITTFVTS